MGINRDFAAVILAEHIRNPIGKRVVTAGRQTIEFTPEQAIGFVGNYGIKFNKNRSSRLTVDKLTRASADNGFIRDDAFFRELLKVDSFKSLDVSKYEGATVAVDLNTPQTQFDKTADVIIDGSTLDNCFDFAAVLRNLTRMLSSKGRLLLVNAGSNHSCPYNILTPLWFFDYFVVNSFARCDIYTVVNKVGGMNVLRVDPTTMMHGPAAWTPNIEEYGHMKQIIVVAEMGSKSTFDKNPVQHQYRNKNEYKEYMNNMKPIINNMGEPLIKSNTDHFVHVPPGYTLV
jgi:hypothetical protein